MGRLGRVSTAIVVIFRPHGRDCASAPRSSAAFFGDPPRPPGKRAEPAADPGRPVHAADLSAEPAAGCGRRRRRSRRHRRPPSSRAGSSRSRSPPPPGLPPQPTSAPPGQPLPPPNAPGQPAPLRPGPAGPAPADSAPAAGRGGSSTAPPAQKIVNPTAVFAGLDKITGRITKFDVAINETVQFGALQVTPRVCYNAPPPTETQNTDSFVQVDEITLQGEVKTHLLGLDVRGEPGPARCRASDLRRVAHRLQRRRAAGRPGAGAGGLHLRAPNAPPRSPQRPPQPAPPPRFGPPALRTRARRPALHAMWPRQSVNRGTRCGCPRSHR